MFLGDLLTCASCLSTIVIICCSSFLSRVPCFFLAFSYAATRAPFAFFKSDTYSAVCWCRISEFLDKVSSVSTSSWMRDFSFFSRLAASYKSAGISSSVVLSSARVTEGVLELVPDLSSLYETKTLLLVISSIKTKKPTSFKKMNSRHEMLRYSPPVSVLWCCVTHPP